MQILYNVKTDLLYIRLDDRKQAVINKRLSEDIVLDIGEEDMIVGIEILDAYKHLNLGSLLPVKYQTMVASEAVLRRDWERPEEDIAWANL
jgi:uncharacterized protein YuzE